MEVSSDLEAYLEELQRAGEIDSKGVFTLDLRRSLEKLSRFQLATPYHYILCLLSCAVLADAQGLQIAGPLEDRELTLAGAGFSILEMGRLFTGFAVSHNSEPRLRALHHLGIAMRAVLNLSGGYVSGLTCDGQSGAGFTLSQGNLTIDPTGPGVPLTRLYFCLRPSGHRQQAGDVARRVLGMAPVPDRDLDLLRRFGRYAPLPITLNAGPFGLTRLGEWKDLLVVNPADLPPSLRPARVARERTCERPDLPFRGFLGDGPGGGGLALVVEGILYCVELAELGPDFRGLIWHDGLPRDLSFNRLIEGAQWDEFCGQLRGLCSPQQSEGA